MKVVKKHIDVRVVAEPFMDTKCDDKKTRLT